MTRWLCVFLTATFLTSSSAYARQPQHPAGRADLPGLWVLNEELSDEVPLLPGEAVSRTLSSGSGPVVAAKRRSAGRADQHQIAKVRTVLRGELHAARRLSFRTEGRLLKVAASSQQMVSFVPDGRKLRVEHDGMGVDVVAQWDDPELLVERRYPDGTIVKDRYATFSGPRQLVITSTIRNVHLLEPPVTLRRVYDEVR